MNKTTKTVFAIPAFFAGKKVTAKDVPGTKKDLLKILDKDNLPEETFINRYPYSSHKKYNIDKWKTTDEEYEVTASNNFEPYYVGRRDYPLFDETYYGCGGDKISHTRELKALGYKFVVLPQGFIVHLNSDGLGKPWCTKNGAGPRGTLKRKVAGVRQRLYPEALLNNYEIPWWADQDQKGAPKENKVENENENVIAKEEAFKETKVDYEEKEEVREVEMKEEKKEIELDKAVEVNKNNINGDRMEEVTGVKYDKIIASFKKMEENNSALKKEIETLQSYLIMALIAIVFMACVTAYHYKERKRAEKEYKLP